MNRVFAEAVKKNVDELDELEGELNKVQAQSAELRAVIMKANLSMEERLSEVLDLMKRHEFNVGELERNAKSVSGKVSELRAVEDGVNTRLGDLETRVVNLQKDLILVHNHIVWTKKPGTRDHIKKIVKKAKRNARKARV